MDNFTVNKDRVKCEDCAYQEAGHILFAYLCGYGCKEAQLIEENNENDFSSYSLIDYGDDSWLASRFLGEKAGIGFFKGLTFGERLEGIEVGRRIARIFLGGSVAASVFRNKGKAPLPLQLEYTDLLKAEFVHYVIREISTYQEENFIENGLREALYTLSNVNIWDTIEDLASMLLASGQISRGDIEECLEKHGIYYDEASAGMPDK